MASELLHPLNDPALTQGTLDKVAQEDYVINRLTEGEISEFDDDESPEDNVPNHPDANIDPDQVDERSKAPELAAANLVTESAETREQATNEGDTDTAPPVTFDLGEAVGDLDKAKVIRDLADDQSKRFSDALQAFKDQHPSLQFGITPYDVNAMPEYQLLSKNSDFAFNGLRRVNEWIVKNFKNENSEDVRKGREVRLANAPLFESLKKAGVLYIQRGKSLYLGKLNKATDDTTIQQYTNNKQADNAVAKLIGQGFAAHVSARHPFVVVIDGASEPKSVDLPAYQDVAGAVDAPIQISGDELGDFPDTPDGKRALREVVRNIFMAMRDDSVECPILGRSVTIRKRGIKETFAFTGDTRKLKMIPHIKEIIKTAFKKSEENNIKRDKKPSVFRYLKLTSNVFLDGKQFPVEVIIEEGIDGALYYDFIVDPEEAETKTALDSSSTADVSTLPTNHNSVNIDTFNIVQNEESVNNTLDSVVGMVLNLFIVGEKPEIMQVDNSIGDSESVEVKKTELDGRAAS